MQNEKMVLGFPAPMLFDNQNSKEWLATKEATKFLGVSPNAVRIMVHRD
jgi:hypothetical protein